MRRLMTGVVVTLLLAGCDSSADPGLGPGEPTPMPQSTAPSIRPAISSDQEATEAELGAVCDTLGRTVTLPGAGAVQYEAGFQYSIFATNAPMCGIEPDGEYYDVAAKVPVFGRAKFDYGKYPDRVIQKVGYPRYTPETAEESLAIDRAEPVGDSLPCVNKRCKSIHGYQYNFQFKAVIGNISVHAKFDYITTDVKGDKKPQYRALAIKEFKASMEVIAAELT